MLKGCNYPLTPKGKSTLNPRPPWYYSSDFLNIEFWSQPSAVAALIAYRARSRSPRKRSRQCFFLRLAVQRGERRIPRSDALSVSRVFHTRRCAIRGEAGLLIAPISLSITMRHLLAAGLRDIQSDSARCLRPGITPRQEMQAPRSHQDRSLPVRLPQADNGLLRHSLR